MSLRRAVIGGRPAAWGVALTGMFVVSTFLATDLWLAGVQRDQAEQVERLEEAYGVQVVGASLPDGQGWASEASIEVDGEVLQCEVVAQPVGFDVSCYTPNGWITLEKVL